MMKRMRGTLIVDDYILCFKHRWDSSKSTKRTFFFVCTNLVMFRYFSCLRIVFQINSSIRMRMMMMFGRATMPVSSTIHSSKWESLFRCAAFEIAFKVAFIIERNWSRRRTLECLENKRGSQSSGKHGFSVNQIEKSKRENPSSD